MKRWRLIQRLIRRPVPTHDTLAARISGNDEADSGVDAGSLPLVMIEGSPAGPISDEGRCLPLPLELEDGLSVQVRVTEENAGQAVHATQRMLDECHRCRRGAEPEAAWIGTGEESTAFV